MKRRLLKRRLRISKNLWVLLLIIALFGSAIWVLTPSGSAFLDREKGDLGMRLGLDLKGGTHLVYQAKFPEGTAEEKKASWLDMAVSTIQKRIDKYGVTEPILQKQGKDRILVQLPGITDVEEAKKLIEETAFLEFREVELKGGNPVYLSDYLDDEDPSEFFNEEVEGTRIFAGTFLQDEEVKYVTLPVFLERDEEGNFKYVDEEDKPIFLEKDDEGFKFLDEEGNLVVDIGTLEQAPEALLSWMPAIGEIDGEEKLLTGAYLKGASPQYTGEPGGIGAEIQVKVEWNDEGGKLFDQVAARLYDRGYGTPENRIGIFLDNELISSPQVREREYHGEGVITGDFTWDEARLLAIQLDSGALPMPLEKPPLYEKNVSATLGADFIDRAILAGVIGLVVIILFMVLYYRLPGVLASLALLIYVVLVLAIFKLIPVTLTLPGLAGFVLSIGMAVDANVLIFERLKEELRGGRTLKAATETGFNRAWVAIRDSNISTFIICGILYWFGSSIVESSQVMGFALTLFIGVALSMFTAIVITRTFLRFSTAAWAARRLTWFGVEAKGV